MLNIEALAVAIVGTYDNTFQNIEIQLKYIAIKQEYLQNNCF